MNEASLQRALKMEQKLAELPPFAGLLFVSVRPEPAPEGQVREYKVRVGVERTRTERMMEAALANILSEDIADKSIAVRIEIFRGIAGAGVHDRPGTARPV